MKSFGRYHKPLEERAKQLENQIPDLQGEIDFLRIQYLSSDQILNEAKDLYSRWKDLTPEEKQKIVENITEKIIIGQEDVTINLAYLPSSPKLMATEQHKHTLVLPFCHLILKSSFETSCASPCSSS